MLQINIFLQIIIHKGKLAVQCWIVLAIGIIAAILNELKVKLMISNASNERQINSTTPLFTDQSTLLSLTLLDIFHWAIMPLVAGICSFVDLSVIHLSIIFSCYQRQLRERIDRWSSLNLQEKERLRLTYWNIQVLIKVVIKETNIYLSDQRRQNVVSLVIGSRRNIFFRNSDRKSQLCGSFSPRDQSTYRNKNRSQILADCWVGKTKRYNGHNNLGLIFNRPLCGVVSFLWNRSSREIKKSPKSLSTIWRRILVLRSRIAHCKFKM